MQIVTSLFENIGRAGMDMFICGLLAWLFRDTSTFRGIVELLIANGGTLALTGVAMALIASVVTNIISSRTADTRS